MWYTQRLTNYIDHQYSDEVKAEHLVNGYKKLKPRITHNV